MEYLITNSLPFDQIEAKIVEALEQHGLWVQRTFSLRSAVAADRGQASALVQAEQSVASGGRPGYSVLMLYAAGALRRPLGLVTLYQQGTRTLINPVLTPECTPLISSVQAGRATGGEGTDAEADLVATLVRGGLDLCIAVAGEGGCVDPGLASENPNPATQLVQDPVCGKWLAREWSQAGIEYRGEVYYVCCPLCRDEFEGNPEHYAQAG
jgi:xanthine dehydrogenase accessory factor